MKLWQKGVFAVWTERTCPVPFGFWQPCGFNCFNLLSDGGSLGSWNAAVPEIHVVASAPHKLSFVFS